MSAGRRGELVRRILSLRAELAEANRELRELDGLAAPIRPPRKARRPLSREELATLRAVQSCPGQRPPFYADETHLVTCVVRDALQVLAYRGYVTFGTVAGPHGGTMRIYHPTGIVPPLHERPA